MKIIILGAGQVGASVAENLASEANDITLVDTSPDSLGVLRDRLEVRTVCGNAASPSVLREAGANDADLLIAVTQSDQTNLCACRIAKVIFNLPTRIARLRSTDYVDYPELLDETNFAVDFSICPEQVVTDYIKRLIAFPEALQVLEFAGGVLSLICVCAFEGGPLVGHPLKALKFHLPNVEVRIAAIYRNGVPIIPQGDTIIVPGDEVFCLAASVHIRQVMRELRRSDKPMRRIMIAGGGNIGFRLARSIEADYHVKILEARQERAELLASQLSRALVLRGDSTDEKLLEAEGIDETDLFVALTNDEEDNIMSALVAKRMGARRTLALINRKSYVDLVQGGPIDIAISPAHTSIGTLLAHVRRGDVVAVHSLRRGAAEALEIIAHGSRKDSKVVGRPIEEIPFPKGATIGAIVREVKREDGRVLRREVIMPHHDTVIEENDHVIVFCTHKNLVRKVEKVFQVGFHFL
ncbi:Trk system potassium transporter TrkA [Thauera linaloolentis]|uniref:Trk system potassium uptake protein TrkA n=1 Tax=Thauera linaloolentis (strain DSM 12138 / JCM 21573 / CCUG 41526 / CIP 105981 / IAM 15112 / NBRC 102519 / 47Lol) TaxID=1123367 RepID=N6YTJ2_THAL4|nr:Trk system potassium transporter TrkA [Thauera linaloolentis]ENO85478.1 potassium transporter peripheral membrane component [Thauera linaloolentis 47Lol = DSM 12138]MCM8566509.1 Trk system potassium transporter TrkA [Thauera linaloolentis]